MLKFLTGLGFQIAIIPTTILCKYFDIPTRDTKLMLWTLLLIGVTFEFMAYWDAWRDHKRRVVLLKEHEREMLARKRHLDEVKAKLQTAKTQEEVWQIVTELLGIARDVNKDAREVQQRMIGLYGPDVTTVTEEDLLKIDKQMGEVESQLKRQQNGH
jgi:hypothetical protein